MPHYLPSLLISLILISSISLIPLSVSEYPTPIKQIKTGVASLEVKCNEGFILTIKNEDYSSACVKPETAKKLTERGWSTSDFTYANNSISSSGIMNVTNSKLSIIFTISNAKILDNKYDFPSKSLIVSIKAVGYGVITMTIPRELMDAKANNHSDDKFIVLNDGREINYDEIKQTATDRTLSISFNQGIHEIEIIGTWFA